MSNYPDDFNGAAFDRAWGGLTELQEAEFAYELSQMDAARAAYRDILAAAVSSYRRHGIPADRARFEQYAEQVAEMVEDDVYSSYRTLRDNDIDVTPVGDPRVLSEILAFNPPSDLDILREACARIAQFNLDALRTPTNPATYDQLGKDI
jgi:hypothetical protein